MSFSLLKRHTVAEASHTGLLVQQKKKKLLLHVNKTEYEFIAAFHEFTSNSPQSSSHCQKKSYIFHQS